MPHVLCIIPARGGSTRVQRKNVLPVGGCPLVAHSILQAKKTKGIDEVVVSTEDSEIADVARLYGATVHARPQSLASNTATSESALLDVLDARKRQGLAEPDIVVFLQATSPVRKIDDIAKAIDQFEAEACDSLLSVTDNNRFLWEKREGHAQSINYNFQKRQREQDLSPQYQENGSIYIFKTKLLREQNNRLGGQIGLYVMNYWTGFQVDEPEDFQLIQWILERPEFRLHLDWPSQVDLVVFDFDGVFTPNTVIVDQQGKESVLCNRGDGMGIAELRDLGVPMLVLSSEKNPVVSARCQKLGLEHASGIRRKSTYLKEFCKKNGYDLNHVVYLGNDRNDLGCLALVGYPMAVADAYPEVKQSARFILSQNGGAGAVRALCDQLAKSLAPQRKAA